MGAQKTLYRQSAKVAVFAAFVAFSPGDARAQALNPTNTEIGAFAQADRDGNLWLTLSEFRIFVNAMARAGQPTARKIRFFGAYKYAFSVADLNDDGRVTPMEMRSADNGFRASDGG
jgi:Ca2+-binding EF-hand superfamily protein